MRVGVLLLLILSACRLPVLPAIDSGLPDPDAGVRPVLAHAHNDYEHTHPLFDALDLHFDSVEADCWVFGADIGVSHDGAPFKGTLRDLYLNPLDAQITNHNGSVYGDGKPFYLWIELKESDTALQDSITAQLAGYDWLTIFNDTTVIPGAVTVVLTGNGAKSKMVAHPAPRRFIRDGDYKDTDPPADTRWGYYAVNYYTYLNWNGDGAMPAGQRMQLKNLIDGAHAKGRKIRVYMSPDKPEYWRTAREFGQDFLGADDLLGLRTALDNP